MLENSLEIVIIVKVKAINNGLTMIKNTENSYGTVAKILHWIVALMIISLIIVGFVMSDMENSDQKWQLYGAHKATGVLVLALIIVRLLWRLVNKTVLLPATVPAWQKKLAYITHIFLYCAMLTMAISGFSMSVIGGHAIDFYGLFVIPAFAKNEAVAKIFWQIHGYTAYIIVGLIATHFLGALYHHYVLKDNVLVRMISNTVSHFK